MDITPSSKAYNEFIITMKKGMSLGLVRCPSVVTSDLQLFFSGKKSQTMTFSCDYRAELLTEVLVSSQWGGGILAGHMTLTLSFVRFLLQRFSPLFCEARGRVDKVRQGVFSPV